MAPSTRTSSATPTPDAPIEAPAPDGEPAVVVDVIDGDTIDVVVGGREERVRYIGIDTPEFDQCYYDQATAANVALVQGHEVVLVSDPVADRDNTGARRLLRYVFVDDVFVNEQLVAQGYADATSNFPERRFRTDLLAAEASAIAGALGIWSNCPGFGRPG